MDFFYTVPSSLFSPFAQIIISIKKYNFIGYKYFRDRKLDNNWKFFYFYYLNHNFPKIKITKIILLFAKLFII
jgi:hypothetical protein